MSCRTHDFGNGLAFIVDESQRSDIFGALARWRMLEQAGEFFAGRKVGFISAAP